MAISRPILLALLVSALLPSAGMSQGQAVAVSIGQDGAARITLPNGRTTIIRRRPGQVGIREALVSSDGTVGWLGEYRVDGVSYPVALTLTIWRAGNIARLFRADQSFYSWAFYGSGKQVAYHVGPLHGERAAHCELHDVGSGRLIAEWDGDLASENDRPAWTRDLHH
jgi:hypothetical protein